MKNPGGKVLSEHEIAQVEAAKLALDGFKASEIGGLLGVHRGTVWRWSQSPAYKAQIKEGGGNPRLGAYYRLIKRDKDITARLSSTDKVIARRAARKILSRVVVHELIP